jgi:hypothetical protein
MQWVKLFDIIPVSGNDPTLEAGHPVLNSGTAKMINNSWFGFEISVEQNFERLFGLDHILCMDRFLSRCVWDVNAQVEFKQLSVSVDLGTCNAEDRCWYVNKRSSAVVNPQSRCGGNFGKLPESHNKDACCFVNRPCRVPHINRFNTTQTVMLMKQCNSITIWLHDYILTLGPRKST